MKGLKSQLYHSQALGTGERFYGRIVSAQGRWNHVKVWGCWIQSDVDIVISEIIPGKCYFGFRRQCTFASDVNISQEITKLGIVSRYPNRETGGTCYRRQRGGGHPQMYHGLLHVSIGTQVAVQKQLNWIVRCNPGYAEWIRVLSYIYIYRCQRYGGMEYMVVHVGDGSC